MAMACHRKAVLSGGNKAVEVKRLSKNARTDRRVERIENGVVQWNAAQGPQKGCAYDFVTREGHLIKDGDYYSAPPRDNSWNDPKKAGPTTWRLYHGPVRDMGGADMERHDRADEELERSLQKATFQQQLRREAMLRTEDRRAEGEQMAVVTPRSLAERIGESPWNDYGALPSKALRAVLTPRVLRGDKAAMKAAAESVYLRLDAQDNEEAHRRWRHDRTREMIHDSRNCIDHLEDLSGQPPRLCHRGESMPPTRFCTSPRENELAQPSPRWHRPRDITKYPAFRGLLHADHHGAVVTSRKPALHPLNLSSTFRQIVPAADVPMESTPRVPATHFRKVLPGKPPPPPPPPPPPRRIAKVGQASSSMGFQDPVLDTRSVVREMDDFEAHRSGFQDLAYGNFFARAPGSSTVWEEPKPPVSRDALEMQGSAEDLRFRLDPSCILALTPRMGSQQAAEMLRPSKENKASLSAFPTDAVRKSVEGVRKSVEDAAKAAQQAAAAARAASYDAVPMEQA